MTAAAPAAGSRTARDEFREHWPLLLAATMGVGISSAHGYTVGVFLKPLEQEFGWSAQTVLLGPLIVGLLSGFGAPLTGRVMDRIGARPIALGGTLLFVLGYLLLSAVPHSFAAYLGCYVFIALGSVMASGLIFQKYVVDRFVAARGLAVSIALCGSNFAGAVTPILCTLVLERAGWRAGYVALAAYMFVSTFPLAWIFYREKSTRHRLVRTGPVDEQPQPAARPFGLTTAEAARTREFWLMITSFTLAGFGITGYMVNFVPMLTTVGLPLLEAASVVSTMSIAAIIGRLMAGAVMDRMFAPRIAAFALCLPLLSSALLLSFPPGYAVALCAALFVGLSTGAEFNMVSFLTARYFGLRHYGTLGGILYGSFMLGCIAGQQIPALLLRWTGYPQIITLFGACFFIAAALMLLCRPYERLAAR